MCYYTNYRVTLHSPYKIGLIHIHRCGQNSTWTTVHYTFFTFYYKIGIQITFKCTLADNQYTQSLNPCLHMYAHTWGLLREYEGLPRRSGNRNNSPLLFQEMQCGTLSYTTTQPPQFLSERGLKTRG